MKYSQSFTYVNNMQSRQLKTQDSANGVKCYSTITSSSSVARLVRIWWGCGLSHMSDSEAFDDKSGS